MATERDTLDRITQILGEPARPGEAMERILDTLFEDGWLAPRASTPALRALAAEWERRGRASVLGLRERGLQPALLACARELRAALGEEQP